MNQETDIEVNALPCDPKFFSDADFSDCALYLPAFTYLGVYCSYASFKKIKCMLCKEILALDNEIILDQNNNLIKDLDKGGLKCPIQFITSVILFNYFVVKLFSDDNEFFHKINQKAHIKHIKTH